MSFKLEFYETPSGRSAAYDFIMSLSPKQQSKVYGTLKLLSDLGPEINSSYSKHLGDGIFELRCQFGSDAIRVLYFFQGNKIIVLTNGFYKKTQKTPKREIEQAKKARRDYLERKAIQ